MARVKHGDDGPLIDVTLFRMGRQTVLQSRVELMSYTMSVANRQVTCSELVDIFRVSS